MDEAHVELDPPSALTFQLIPGVEPTITMEIQNLVDSPVIFKVYIS